MSRTVRWFDDENMRCSRSIFLGGRKSSTKAFIGRKVAALGWALVVMRSERNADDETGGAVVGERTGGAVALAFLRELFHRGR